MPAKKQEKKKAVKIKKPVSKETKKSTNKKAKKPVKKKTTKKEVKKEVNKKPVIKKTAKKETREKIWATGKRKTSIAQVQCFPNGKGNIYINKRMVQEYFPIFELEKKVLFPLKELNKEKDFDFKIKVQGGGVRGQADAVSLGIARALVSFNPEWRKILKKVGLLKRDPRKKERKKPGLKRARRAPQWRKR